MASVFEWSGRGKRCSYKLGSKLVGLVILSSQLVFISSALALPAGVPNQLCGTLSNPTPGTLCYTVTQGGGKANSGSHRLDFVTTIQATEPEYVIADVVTEVTSKTNSAIPPTINQLSPGGTASVVSVANDKLRELKQIRAELEGKVNSLAGPALIEAQMKLSALMEQERTYEQTVTTTTEAGKDAGKFQVIASAIPTSCGIMNINSCGSWVNYDIYVVKRYVGNPIVAYNKAYAVAADARSTIDRLVAANETQKQTEQQEAALALKAQNDAKQKLLQDKAEKKRAEAEKPLAEDQQAADDASLTEEQRSRIRQIKAFTELMRALSKTQQGTPTGN